MSLQDKTKWALVLGVCLIAVISALIVGLVGGEEAPEERPRVIPRVRPGPTLVRQPTTPPNKNSELSNTKEEPPDPNDALRAKVATLWEEFERETDREKAADLLHRSIGGIYRTIGEYEQAATCYEKVLREYPHYSMRHSVYYSLVSMYETLGEQNNARQVCLDMVDAFPPGSPHREWALERLGMREWETPPEPEPISDADLGEEESDDGDNADEQTVANDVDETDAAPAAAE